MSNRNILRMQLYLSNILKYYVHHAQLCLFITKIYEYYKNYYQHINDGYRLKIRFREKKMHYTNDYAWYIKYGHKIRYGEGGQNGL